MNHAAKLEIIIKVSFVSFHRERERERERERKRENERDDQRREFPQRRKKVNFFDPKQLSRFCG